MRLVPTHHVHSILKLTCRPLIPLLSISQHASIWQEVPTTFAGSFLQVKPADTTVDRSCDEVRRQINRLIECREFTVKSFCQKIGVSLTSYYRFMHQNGAWKGEKGDTFPSALCYLQQRERDGVTMPRKVRARKKSDNETKEVKLEGEESDKVPVFDTCDAVRRKINNYLRQPSNTQASLLKSLSSHFHSIPTRIRPSQLEKFRHATGPNVGNTNPVFYAGYVLFEKERLRLKKKKSKHREQMEEIYGAAKGVNVKTPTDKYGAWVGKQERGTNVHVDEFGLANTYGKSNAMYGPRGRPTPQWLDDPQYLYMPKWRDYIYE